MPLLDPPLPTDRLHITPWNDPILDRIGHDPRSGYVERFWLPILGPTTTVLLRRLASQFDATPDGFDLTVVDTAAEIGLGGRAGRNGPFLRAFGRASQFKLSQPLEDDVMAVRRLLPPLSGHQAAKLPGSLTDEHRRWQREQAERPDVDHQRRRARRLALSLVELGEPDEAVERQLHRWGLHPALAHDALRWANQRRHGDGTETPVAIRSSGAPPQPAGRVPRP